VSVVQRDNPLLWGISNRLLFWATYVRRTVPKPDPDVIATSFTIPKNSRAVELVRPGALVRIPCGKGAVILDGLGWHSSRKNLRDITSSLAGALLTNLGLRFPAKDATALIDRPMSLRFEPAQAESYAWQKSFNAAYAPLLAQSQLDLAQPAQVSLAGTPFQIAWLARPGYALIGPGKRIALAADALFDEATFLHVIARAEKPPKGVVAKYILHYSDGSTIKRNVTVGQDIALRTAPPANLPNAPIAYLAPGDADGVLHAMRWRNPFPDRRVSRIELTGTGSAICAVFAVTTGLAATPVPPSPYTVKRAAVTVDGNLADWEGVTPIRVFRKRQVVGGRERWGGPEAFEAKAYAATDGKKLFLAFAVTDAVRTNPYAKALHRADSIEIFLDARPAVEQRKKLTPGAPYYHFMTAPPRKEARDMAFIPFSGPSNLGDIQKAASVTANGYVLEFSFPMENFKRWSGKRMGFDFLVNDIDEADSRVVTISWTGLGGQFMAPDRCGSLLFE